MGSQFEGAVTVVTGGGKGLGRGIALEAARRGSDVMIASTSDASESVELVRQLGVRASWVQTDVADYESVLELRERTIQEFGFVSVVVNNAATGASGGLDTADPEKVHRLFSVNIGGVFNGIRVFAEDLKQTASAGRFAGLLNVGSEHSLGVPPHVPPLSAYTTAKYAVLGLTDTARRDFDGSNVAVSLLAPGWILTETVQAHIEASDGFRESVAPIAQTTDEVSRLGLDGLINGERLIITNQASIGFAMTQAQTHIDDIRRRAGQERPIEEWSHDGSGDISKCPVVGHLPGL